MHNIFVLTKKWNPSSIWAIHLSRGSVY